MRLTPGQVADLKSAKNIRGRIGSEVLYALLVRFETLERVQQLADLGEGPPGSWYTTGGDTARATIATSSPEWWVELEEKIDALRRPQQPR